MQNAAPKDNRGEMLSIGKLGRGQARYYLNKVAEAEEDYYSGEGEAPGEWVGDAAAKLGLEGEVVADQLEAMLTEDEATRLAKVRRPDREELRWLEVTERQSRRELERLQAELAAGPAPTDAARRELAVAGQVLAERERLAVAAARAAPPAYIRAELGERPSDPAKQKVWDHAVADIESFRLRNGVTDPKRALGREVERSAQRERQRQTRRQIREANRQLGRGKFGAQRRSIERGGLSIGR